ncbi:MAG: CHASE3 domain-containing protein [Sphingomonas sp.]|nr:CHASE3 domain-containing protein [Sphingomonas sp.]
MSDPVLSARRDRSVIVLIGGFVLLIAAVLATVWLAVEQQRSAELVKHTLRVENQLSGLLSKLQDAETSNRGFLLTGRSEFLQPYDDAVSTINADFGQLREAVADNPRQIEALDRFAIHARERLNFLRLSIENYWRSVPTAPEHFFRGKALMDEARGVVAEMKAEEERLFALRSDRARQQARMVTGALAASILLVLILGLVTVRSHRRRLAEALSAGNVLAETNRLLVAEAESREEAEGRLRQMQKIEAVGQLTGGIAHDFNNMLTLVIGSLDLAQRRMAGGDIAKVGKCIGNAMEGAQNAAQLTARLLAFSRQQPLAPQSIDANKLVGGMSELLRRTLGEQIEVETVLAGGLWRAFVDANQLENAIVNLCVNGRDAMPDGGKLTIETANGHLDDDYAAAHPGVEPGQYAVICVTDTGTGMTPDIAERAFDPFFTTKGPGQGTGLGLSQVFGFVKQSRGHLKIYSEPGHGTTVKIYMPRFLGQEESGTAVASDGAGDLPRARDGEIVLVVEDEERVRHVSVDTLRELGYTVVQASDGHQALAVITLQPRIDLLFTDVVMPDMNGRQLAERAVAERPGLKVLYTTGYTRNAIVHNGMLDAGVAFLAKPFTVEQLAKKVRQVLDEGEAG